MLRVLLLTTICLCAQSAMARDALLMFKSPDEGIVLWIQDLGEELATVERFAGNLEDVIAVPPGAHRIKLVSLSEQEAKVGYFDTVVSDDGELTAFASERPVTSYLYEGVSEKIPLYLVRLSPDIERISDYLNLVITELPSAEAMTEIPPGSFEVAAVPKPDRGQDMQIRIRSIPNRAEIWWNGAPLSHRTDTELLVPIGEELSPSDGFVLRKAGYVNAFVRLMDVSTPEITVTLQKVEEQ